MIIGVLGLKRYWFIFPIIIITLIGVGSYQLENILSKETITTLTTPNLGSLCSSGYYMQGYDSNGSIVCNPLPISNSNNTSYSKLIFWSHTNPQAFSTTSKTFVYTGYPANGTFVKKYDDSYLRVTSNLDYKNSMANKTNVIEICFDNNCSWNTIWGETLEIPNVSMTTSFVKLVPGKHLIGWGACDSCMGAGTHTIKFFVRVSDGNGTFSFNHVELAIEEFYP